MAGSIRKRSKNSYEVTYDAGVDPTTGRRIRRFATVKGTRKDAERALRDSLHQRDMGIDIEPSKMTVSDFMERWLRDYAKGNVAPSTFERYSGIVHKHVDPTIGTVLLTKLRPAHLQAAYAKWQEAKLSPASVLYHHRVIREALSHAVGWQLLALNPADAAKPPRAERSQVVALEPDGVTELLTAADVHSEPYPTLIQFALATGMRQGEMLGLRWQDTDLSTGTIRVVRTARRFTGKGIVFGSPKTHRSRRPVKLDDDTVALLRAHRARQNEQRLALGSAWEDNDLVFCSPLGAALDGHYVLKVFQRITVAAGLGKIHFHSLRHTCGTMMASAGVNPRFIADRLGHANATFTLNTYVHTTKDADAEAAERVGEALRAARKHATS